MTDTPQSNSTAADAAPAAGQAAVKAEKHGRLVGNLSMFVVVILRTVKRFLSP